MDKLDKIDRKSSAAVGEAKAEALLFRGSRRLPAPSDPAQNLAGGVRDVGARAGDRGNAVVDQPGGVLGIA